VSELPRARTLFETLVTLHKPSKVSVLHSIPDVEQVSGKRPREPRPVAANVDFSTGSSNVEHGAAKAATNNSSRGRTVTMVSGA
jgi:hypothetical protein